MKKDKFELEKSQEPLEEIIRNNPTDEDEKKPSPPTRNWKSVSKPTKLGQLGLKIGAKRPEPVDLGSVSLDTIDTLPKAQRRWTINVNTALGLNSVLGQNKLLSSSIATAVRIDETRLQPKKGRFCSQELRKALYQTTQKEGEGEGEDKAFEQFLYALEKYEKEKVPRPWECAAILKEAATVALAKAVDPRLEEKQHACKKVLADLKPQELLQQVLECGRPAWDGGVGMLVAANKVHLDLLSIPEESRQIEPLGLQGGQNASFWVNRTDGYGEQKKSFLLKTPSTMEKAVDGIPPGGEVARESLACRTASILTGAFNLDLVMPETHVIDLEQEFLPPKYRPGGEDPVTCSVQEVRENSGPLSTKPFGELKKISSTECASIILLDMVTLNTDRHGGNLLMDEDGRPVLIDNGATFSMQTEPGLERIAATMNGPQNVLLSLPGSHDPMPEELVKRLLTFSPSDIVKELKSERDTIENGAPKMQGMISDQSLAMSERSMHFMQLAARMKGKENQVLSPAAIQVAFGTNATELLAPGEKDGFALDIGEFIIRSREILLQAFEDMPLMKLVCLMPPSEYKAIVSTVGDLGWYVQLPGDGPAPKNVTDPVALLKIYTTGHQVESGVGTAEFAKKFLETNKKQQELGNDVVMKQLSERRLSLLKGLIELLPVTSRKSVSTFLSSATKFGMPSPEEFIEFTHGAEHLIKTDIAKRQAFLENTYELNPNDLTWIIKGLNRVDYKMAISALEKLEATCKQGERRLRKQTTGEVLN